MILHITADLMMSSTARAHADSQGVEIVFADTMEKAMEQLREGSFQLCMADLQMPGMDLQWFSDAMHALDISAVAYAQHVNVDMLDQAKELTFGEVMTRGQFNKSVAQIIGQVTQSK